MTIPHPHELIKVSATPKAKQPSPLLKEIRKQVGSALRGKQIIRKPTVPTGFGAVVKDIVSRKVLPGAAVAAGIGGALAVAHGITTLPGLYRRMQSKKNVLEDKDIPKAQKGQAKQYFEILDQYAPSMAENPLVAKSFVKNLLQYEQIDVGPKLVADLIKAQSEKQKSGLEALKPLQVATSTIMGAGV